MSSRLPVTSARRAPENLAILLRQPFRALSEELIDLLAVRGHGEIRYAHGSVFEYLDDAGTRVSVLAERAHMTKQAMAELVAHLEAHGYVERIPDPDDRRAKLVRATARGRAVFAIVREFLAEVDDASGSATRPRKAAAPARAPAGARRSSRPCRCLAAYDRETGAPMPRLIPSPTSIPVPGGKVIDEYVGGVNTGTDAISIAHMRAPADWDEPFQTPEFDEYTLVLKGTLRVEHDGRTHRRRGRAGDPDRRRRTDPLLDAGGVRIRGRVPPRVHARPCRARARLASRTSRSISSTACPSLSR